VPKTTFVEERAMKKNMILMGLVLLLAACGGKNETPNTGNADAELMTSFTVSSREELVQGKIYFVSTNGLRVRSSDEVSNNGLGIVNRNDQLRVVNVGPFNGNYVQVEIVKTEANNVIQPSDRYFVSFKYLEEEKIDYKTFKGDLFVVQNIATERLRVYERVCADNSCPHKMVLEAELAVGEDKNEKVRTWAGSYRLTHWIKFYQDGAAHYPSWYHPSYPKPPKPGKGFMSWMKKKYMPKVDGKRYGDIRGAFGWYTAFIFPNSNAQWTHGTVGWGVDKKKYIHYTKKWISNVVANPRSSGCSRTDNETIAYLRNILPVGTPFIKIYAKEALLDPTLKGYSPINKKWDYILTTPGSRKNGPTADRNYVLDEGIAQDKWIEEGSYDVDQFPTIVEYTPGEDLGRISASLGSKGNVYRVESEKMRGVFYIDAGFVQGYTLPNHESLIRGGFADEEVGPWMNMDKVNL
tara:strand:- start:3519 stop:4913 length:1395 start_codon:yes stop_codon:yes gene_type:complete